MTEQDVVKIMASCHDDITDDEYDFLAEGVHEYGYEILINAILLLAKSGYTDNGQRQLDDFGKFMNRKERSKKIAEHLV